MATDWEALLEREGLGPITPSSRIATKRELELCTSAYNGSASSAFAEIQALEQAVTWLPARDQLAIHLRRQGCTQSQIAEHLGITRRSTREMLERAVGRVQALRAGPLPDDMHHLGELLRDGWGRQRKRSGRVSWRRVKSVLLVVVGTWNMESAARLKRISPERVRTWVGEVSEGDEPRSAHLYTVVRSHPSTVEKR